MTFRLIRWVHRGKVAYNPTLFTNLIVIQDVKNHPTEYDEADEIEYQKTKIHGRKDNWGKETIDME